SELQDLLEREEQWVLEQARRALGHLQPDWEQPDPLLAPAQVARRSSAPDTEAGAADPSARETLEWGAVRDRPLRAALLGDPGSGKTTLLWHEVARRCRAARSEFCERRATSQTLPGALFFSARELARMLPPAGAVGLPAFLAQQAA